MEQVREFVCRYVPVEGHAPYLTYIAWWLVHGGGRSLLPKAEFYKCLEELGKD